MNQNYIDDFKEDHNKYSLIEDTLFETFELFDEAKMNNGCLKCDHYLQFKGLDFDQRFQNCKKEKNCKKIVRLYERVKKLKQEETAFKVDYALKIYHYLDSIAPSLKIVSTGQMVLWEDAFPLFPESIQIDDVDSLVGLIEEDGGRYVFANKR